MGGVLGACYVAALPEMVAEKQYDILLVFRGTTEEQDTPRQD